MRALELIREEGRQEGRKETKATMLLRLMCKRGFAVEPATEARVLATTDDKLLDHWLDRVVIAGSAGEIT